MRKYEEIIQKHKLVITVAINRISVEQFDSLKSDQRSKLQKWWYPRTGDYFVSIQESTNRRIRDDLHGFKIKNIDDIFIEDTYKTGIILREFVNLDNDIEIWFVWEDAIDVPEIFRKTFKGSSNGDLPFYPLLSTGRMIEYINGKKHVHENIEIKVTESLINDLWEITKKYL